MVAEAPYPEVFSQVDGPGEVGTPPQIVLTPAADARVRAAVVRVEGEACNQIQDGTGFVVGPNLVVTNAHVVAGERDTDVFGARRRAVRRAGDPLRPPPGPGRAARCRTSTGRR